MVYSFECAKSFLSEKLIRPGMEIRKFRLGLPGKPAHTPALPSFRWRRDDRRGNWRQFAREGSEGHPGAETAGWGRQRDQRGRSRAATGEQAPRRNMRGGLSTVFSRGRPRVLRNALFVVRAIACDAGTLLHSGGDVRVEPGRLRERPFVRPFGQSAQPVNRDAEGDLCRMIGGLAPLEHAA